MVASKCDPVVGNWRLAGKIVHGKSLAIRCLFCVFRELSPEERERFGLPKQLQEEILPTSQPDESGVPVSIPLAFSMISGVVAVMGVLRVAFAHRASTSER